MKRPTTHRSRSPRTGRSARAALSPYFVEEVAMTRGDVLRARADDEAVSGR